MPNNDTESRWDVVKQIMLFPRFFCFGIPLIVFTSLFFIPEEYSGLIAIAKTMDGTDQNKWLYDMSFISVVIVFLYLHINAFFNSSYHENRYKLVRFLKPRENKPDTDNSDGNAKYLRLFYYLMFIVYVINMNTGAINGSSRWGPEYNRFVFFNFFVQFSFYYIFLVFGLFLFLTKEDVSKGWKFF